MNLLVVQYASKKIQHDVECTLRHNQLVLVSKLCCWRQSSELRLITFPSAFGLDHSLQVIGSGKPWSFVYSQNWLSQKLCSFVIVVFAPYSVDLPARHFLLRVLKESSFKV